MIRTLQHSVIVVYLLVTAAAFVFTMTRFVMPVLPVGLIHWSYGMMAPYQGDVSWNADLFVEGQMPDGTWEEVSLDRYLPYGRGEQTVRKFFHPYGAIGAKSKRPVYTAYFLQILDRERKRGKPYTAIRAFFDVWDRSPGGFAFLHTPLFTKREFITQVQ